jgi:hypothetical protein
MFNNSLDPNADTLALGVPPQTATPTTGAPDTHGGGLEGNVPTTTQLGAHGVPSQTIPPTSGATDTHGEGLEATTAAVSAARGGSNQQVAAPSTHGGGLAGGSGTLNPVITGVLIGGAHAGGCDSNRGGRMGRAGCGGRSAGALHRSRVVPKAWRLGVGRGGTCIGRDGHAGWECQCPEPHDRVCVGAYHVILPHGHG